MTSLGALAPRSLRRQMRVIEILAAAERAGLTPLPAAQLHTLAYFADALAPVWGMGILAGQLLKRRAGPMSPLLQHDVDLLVGHGIVEAQSVRHHRDEDGNWRLDANYQLHHAFADQILERAELLEREGGQLRFVREVVYAAAGLSGPGIAAAPTEDAAYANPLIDDGSMVDIAPTGRPTNASASVALRFGALLVSDVALAPAEMIHLYVRELYNRLQRAA